MELLIEVSIANKVHAGDTNKVICDAIRTVNARDYPAAEIDCLVIACMAASSAYPSSGVWY